MFQLELQLRLIYFQLQLKLHMQLLEKANHDQRQW